MLVSRLPGLQADQLEQQQTAPPLSEQTAPPLSEPAATACSTSKGTHSAVVTMVHSFNLLTKASDVSNLIPEACAAVLDAWMLFDGCC